jgi:hypothetical protein
VYPFAFKIDAIEPDAESPVTVTMSSSTTLSLYKKGAGWTTGWFCFLPRCRYLFLFFLAISMCVCKFANNIPPIAATLAMLSFTLKAIYLNT